MNSSLYNNCAGCINLYTYFISQVMVSTGGKFPLNISDLNEVSDKKRRKKRGHGREGGVGGGRGGGGSERDIVFIPREEDYYTSTEYNKLSNGKNYFFKLKRDKIGHKKPKNRSSTNRNGSGRGSGVERNISLLAPAADILQVENT